MRPAAPGPGTGTRGPLALLVKGATMPVLTSEVFRFLTPADPRDVFCPATHLPQPLGDRRRALDQAAQACLDGDLQMSLPARP